jgi:hypothetical protein
VGEFGLRQRPKSRLIEKSQGGGTVSWLFFRVWHEDFSRRFFPVLKILSDFNILA